MLLILHFLLTSLLSSFNLSTESSVLLASIKSAYFSEERAGKPYFKLQKKESDRKIKTLFPLFVGNQNHPHC